MGVRMFLAAVVMAVMAVGLGSAAAPERERDASPVREAAVDVRGLPARDASFVRRSARGWLTLRGAPDAAFRNLGSAHPGKKTIRVNRTRAQLTGRNGRQRFPYPRGTVVVKTASRSGFTSLIAIMERVSSPSGAGGGWRYVEYKRSSGSQPFYRLDAPQGLCSGCHALADNEQGTDWVFSRLAPRR